MIEITLTVNKANVYDEVAKTSSYTGAKMQDSDVGAYNRIFTTDDDQMMLERFWAETCASVTEQLKPFIVSVNNHPHSHGVELGRNYIATLSMPSTFKICMVDSIESSLFSVFVLAIIAKWYKITNKDEADSYTAEATAAMDDILRKIYYREKPQRVPIKHE